MKYHKVKKVNENAEIEAIGELKHAHLIQMEVKTNYPGHQVTYRYKHYIDKKHQPTGSIAARVSLKQFT